MTTHWPITRRRQRRSEGSSNGRAFTLTELLVVIAMLALLALLAAPGLARSGEKSKRIQCLSNVKQLGLAIQLYGADYQSKLPSGAVGHAAWDIPWGFADQLVSRGAPRRVMYDPGFPEQNDGILWNYSPGSYRTIGYALALASAAAVSSTNQNASLIPKPITAGGLTYPAPLAGERPLVACATISTWDNVINREANKYTRISDGWSQPHRTPHLDGSLPLGGNVGMLDGSVRWVRFASMLPRTAPGYWPYFWW